MISDNWKQSYTFEPVDKTFIYTLKFENKMADTVVLLFQTEAILSNFKKILKLKIPWKHRPSACAFWEIQLITCAHKLRNALALMQFPTHKAESRVEMIVLFILTIEPVDETL